MVVQLYSEKNPEASQGYGLIENLIYRGLLEGQFTPEKVKLEVVKADQAGEKFKNAVKKAKNAKYLDDAEILLVFQSPQNAPTEEEPEGEQEETPSGEGDSGEGNSGENVSESIKVQDLSKSVGLTTVGKKSCGCGKKSCCCGKKKSVKEEEEPKKKAPPKKPASKKDLEKKSCDGDECVGEAEMEATGDALVLKIKDMLKRIFFLGEEEEPEIVKLDGFADGQDTFFAKLSFKE